MNIINRETKQKAVGFDPTLAQRQPYSKHLVGDHQGGMSWTIKDRNGNIEAEGITGDYDAESILKEFNSVKRGKNGMI